MADIRQPQICDDMKKGDLFYWHKKVLCEYIGTAKDGRYMFRTTNGGIIYIFPDKLNTDISKEDGNK